MINESKKKIILTLLVLGLVGTIAPVSGQYYYDPTYVVSSTGGNEFTPGETVSFLPWTAYGHIAGGNVVLYYNVTNSSGIRGDGGYVSTSSPSVNNTPISFGLFPSNTVTGKFAVLWYQNTNTIISSWYQNTVPNVNVTYHVSEVGNFSNKLPGVNITVSSGDFGISDINGTVTIGVYPSSSYTYGAKKDGYEDISGWVLGATGLNGGDEYFTMEPSTRIGNITLYAVTKDAASPASTITGTTISIKNQTGSWYNATYPSGNAVITGTDDLMVNDLSVGQTVTICGSGDGYLESCSNLTIPYDRYLHRIYLTQSVQAPSNGNWNLLVSVVRNLDRKPVCHATITVTTGVSGPGIYTAGTECTTGTATFLNISASASAMVNVVAQGYQSGSAYTPVVPNSTQHVTIELVQIGQTPVTIPISPVPTSALSGNVQPQITDADGNPITTSQGKAEWSFDQFFAILPTLAVIVSSLILIWAAWRGLDIVTNGMTSIIIRRVVEGILKGMFK